MNVRQKVQDASTRPGSAQQRVEDRVMDARLARLFDAGLRAYEQKDWGRARASLVEVVRLRPDYTRRGYRAAALLAVSDAQLGRSAIRGVVFMVLCLAGLSALTLALSILPSRAHTASESSTPAQQGVAPSGPPIGPADNRASRTSDGCWRRLL